MRATVAPSSFISGTVNRSPRMMLHSVQAVWTLPLMWGWLLSIRSRPLLAVTVPQYTQGCKMRASISSAVKSHASILWYALRKNVARPRCDWFQRRIRAFRSSFCSDVNALQRSLRLSRPFFRSLWQLLHSYDKPSGRLFSRWKFSGVASKERKQRKQVRDIIL